MKLDNVTLRIAASIESSQLSGYKRFPSAGWTINNDLLLRSQKLVDSIKLFITDKKTLSQTRKRFVLGLGSVWFSSTCALIEKPGEDHPPGEFCGVGRKRS